MLASVKASMFVGLRQAYGNMPSLMRAYSDITYGVLAVDTLLEVVQHILQMMMAQSLKLGFYIRFYSQGYFGLALSIFPCTSRT